MQTPNETPSISNEKSKRVQTTKEIRESHVLKWKQSGLKMVDYCRENALPISSFSTWAQQHHSVQPSFKPVMVQSAHEKRQQNTIEIISGDRIKIRLHDVTSATVISAIIKEVMRCK